MPEEDELEVHVSLIYDTSHFYCYIVGYDYSVSHFLGCVCSVILLYFSFKVSPGVLIRHYISTLYKATSRIILQVVYLSNLGR